MFNMISDSQLDMSVSLLQSRNIKVLPLMGV